MARRRRTKTSEGTQSKCRQVTQNAQLLDLPGELRNRIYELGVKDAVTFLISHNRICYNLPLSRVCRQIRQEYAQIYKLEAPKHASIINIHLTDFVWNTKDVDICAAIRALPPPAFGNFPIYVLKILLTKAWDAEKQQRLTLVKSSERSLTKIDEVKFQWEGNPPFRSSYGLDFPFLRKFAPRCHMFNSAVIQMFEWRMQESQIDFDEEWVNDRRQERHARLRKKHIKASKRKRPRRRRN